MNSEQREREAFYPLDEIVKFLLGEGPLAGYYFGEKPTYEKGNYWWRKHLRAALSTEAQPEVTGAVAYLDYNGVLKPTRDGVVSMKKGDNLYPASAIQAAVREKLEEIHRICEVEKAGYDEPPSGWDRTDPTHAEYFGYQQACDDIAERIRALMESPHTSVEEPTK